MHHTKLLKGFVFGVIACWFAAFTAFGQGITTSSISGTVTTASGEPIAGATVRATHLPTNTTFTAVSSQAGRFTLTGLPVGGPYSVEASAPSYTFGAITNVQTQLGASTEVNFVPSEGAAVTQLEKFVVTGEVNDLDANTTGASSELDARRVNDQPSVSRSFADMIKTNPFVAIRSGQALEALGMNNRYNSITLDGAPINDSFGLSSTGLFSLNNPFSLDAVEQFSISLTPYDVRQSGFAGAAVNVVSKSGTNQFHGSVYDIFTDSNWGGKDIYGSTKGTRPVSKERTYGFTLGGPIVKNRLFFFMNFEKYISDSAPTSAAFTPSNDFLSAVTSRIAQLTKTDMGTFGGSSTSRLFDTKRLLKLDWNINDNHRLSVRYSDTIGAQPNFGSFRATGFSQPVTIPYQPSYFSNGATSFNSNFYTLNIKEHVWAGQLFDNWTPNFKTQFNYSYTKQDSVRGTPVIFPEIRIMNVPGTSPSGASISSSDAFRFGTETSSMGNELHIKTQTFGGSADYTWRTFTFTLGADDQSSRYYNLFRQGSYGIFDYNSLADFQADKPFGFARSVVQTGLPIADISKFDQVGVFGQAKWEPTSRLMLTAGLRADYLGSPIAPAENAAFKNAFGMTNAGTIDGTNVPAPRFSFNYALDKQRTTQIRGGIGVFLGRNPWVWISNSYGNTGVGRFNVLNGVTGNASNTASYSGPTLSQYLNGNYTNSDPAYKFDPANPVGTTSATGSASSIALIKPGMKLPTIQRANIAIDHKIALLNAVVSVEYIDTEQLSALFADNMNLKPTGRGIDGRQLFAGSTSSAPLVKGFGDVIRTRSIHAGHSEYTSISLDRPMKNGWAYNIAYTHGHATEAQTLNSSVARSNWVYNPVFNQNSVEVARSDYEVRDRLQITFTREFHFMKRYATDVTLYYEARSGTPYSMVYANDLNGDGNTANDVVAVPSGLNDPRFDFSGMTQAQQNAYMNFINNSDFRMYKGSYAPRNAFLTPWQNRLDLHVSQEVSVYRGTKVVVFADFLNFGSWLSKSLFNYVETFNPLYGGATRLFGAATYGSDGRIKPTFNNGSTPILSLDSSGNLQFASSGSQINPTNTENRWKVQAGVKVAF